MTNIPILEIREKNGSNGKTTYERDHLVFTRLQTYGEESRAECEQARRDHLDDLINQLIIMRACV